MEKNDSSGTFQFFVCCRILGRGMKCEKWDLTVIKIILGGLEWEENGVRQTPVGVFVIQGGRQVAVDQGLQDGGQLLLEVPDFIKERNLIKQLGSDIKEKEERRTE